MIYETSGLLFFARACESHVTATEQADTLLLGRLTTDGKNIAAFHLT